MAIKLRISVEQLIQDDEFKLLLSELKTKAKIDARVGETTPTILHDNFGGFF